MLMKKTIFVVAALSSSVFAAKTSRQASGGGPGLSKGGSNVPVPSGRFSPPDAKQEAQEACVIPMAPSKEKRYPDEPSPYPPSSEKDSREDGSGDSEAPMEKEKIERKKRPGPEGGHPPSGGEGGPSEEDMKKINENIGGDIRELRELFKSIGPSSKHEAVLKATKSVKNDEMTSDSIKTLMLMLQGEDLGPAIKSVTAPNLKENDKKNYFFRYNKICESINSKMKQLFGGGPGPKEPHFEEEPAGLSKDGDEKEGDEQDGSDKPGSGRKEYGKAFLVGLTQKQFEELGLPKIRLDKGSQEMGGPKGQIFITGTGKYIAVSKVTKEGRDVYHLTFYETAEAAKKSLENKKHIEVDTEIVMSKKDCGSMKNMSESMDTEGDKNDDDEASEHGYEETKEGDGEKKESNKKSSSSEKNTERSKSDKPSTNSKSTRQSSSTSAGTSSEGSSEGMVIETNAEDNGEDISVSEDSVDDDSDGEGQEQGNENGEENGEETEQGTPTSSSSTNTKKLRPKNNKSGKNKAPKPKTNFKDMTLGDKTDLIERRVNALKKKKDSKKPLSRKEEEKLQKYTTKLKHLQTIQNTQGNKKDGVSKTKGDTNAKEDSKGGSSTMTYVFVGVGVVAALAVTVVAAKFILSNKSAPAA